MPVIRHKQDHMQINENFDNEEAANAAKYATETHEKKRSTTSRSNTGKPEHGKPATSSLTAEYNSRYSRNQEEKKNNN